MSRVICYSTRLQATRFVRPYRLTPVPGLRLLHGWTRARARSEVGRLEETVFQKDLLQHAQNLQNACCSHFRGEAAGRCFDLKIASGVRIMDFFGRF